MSVTALPRYATYNQVFAVVSQEPPSGTRATSRNAASDERGTLLVNFGRDFRSPDSFGNLGQCELFQVEPFFFIPLRFRRIQFPVQSSFRLLQLVKKFGTDGQQIASGQADDLIHIPEACPHHLRLVSVFLVIVVDASDRRNAGIFIRRNLFASALLLIPIVNAADERRNQGYSGFGARHGLGKAE